MAAKLIEVQLASISCKSTCLAPIVIPVSYKPETDVAEFIQAISLLVRRVRAAAASHELSLTEAAVLGRLEREGPATTADLARAESMKPQSMGTTVAALEEMRLVERKPHATDGRQFHIVLTAKGVATRERIRDAKRSWLAEVIAQLDQRDRQTLFKAGAIIKRLVESDSR
jgi:DNA-binding MarR family transcriptional regulator